MSRERGRIYEELAADYLISRGLCVVSKNFYCKSGELDLVCREQQELVFVEVKFRKNAAFGNPTEMISFSKQRKLAKTAEFFLLQNSQYRDLPCRFDVVGITGQTPGQQNSPKIDWIKNAFLIT